jgi:hypothetical protein
MTFARVIVAGVSLVVAFVLGVFAGPFLLDKPTPNVEKAAVEAKDTTVAVGTKGSARAENRTRKVSEAPVAKVSATEADVQKQLKPIMNRGTDMKIAADGFRDAEQFATVAHAAHNTQIPFVVLKHRVLEQGKSLAAAIEEHKPRMNGAEEARRARDAARRDIAQVMTDRRAEGEVATR